MARTDTIFRQCWNALLDRLAAMPPGAALPSEVQLATAHGVSRSVIRAAMARLMADGVVTGPARARVLARRPYPRDRLPLRVEYIGHEVLEARFLDWVLRFDVPAGTALNVAQLARQFQVPPHALQAFLASLGQSGLVERRAQGGWRLLGFTPAYAVELSDFREVLELDAIRRLVTLPDAHPVWQTLRALRADHHALLARIETDFHDFSGLDERFHAALNSVVANRFVAQFQKVISLIFHYHYQWDKTLERHRNEAAIGEHFRILDALFARDGQTAEQAARAHLTTAKQTLLSAMRDHGQSDAE